jgi:Flp pilus assembly protein TadG
MINRLCQLLRWRCGEEGASAVELAIVLPLFLLLVVGGMDLGHMYYIEHVVTTASREGARFGAKYSGNPPVDPSQTQITNYVKSLVSPPLSGLDVSAPAYTTNPGPPSYRIITVTVTAPKHWWLLGTFNFYHWVPFPNPKTMTASTAMRVEY